MTKCDYNKNPLRIFIGVGHGGNDPLTDQEKETIIMTTEADHTVTICTYNAALKQTMTEFSAAFPTVCSLMYQTPEGRVTYSMEKAWVSACFLPLMMQDYAFRSLPSDVLQQINQLFRQPICS